jgi:hypothetical protein
MPRGQIEAAGPPDRRSRRRGAGDRPQHAGHGGDTRHVAPLLPDGRFAALPRLDAPDYRAGRKAAVGEFLGLG